MGLIAKNNHVVNIFAIIFVLAFFHNIYTKKNVLPKFNSIIGDKIWVASLLLIIVWSLYVLFFKDPLHIYKEENQDDAEIATKHALVALFISLLDYLDMNIWIFWTIWIMAFQLENWD
jgi:hypothetical protein